MHSQIWANASPALDVYAELEDTSPTAAGPCRFPGCGKLAAGAGHGEGYCQTHYKRLKRSGSVEGGKVARRDDLHRAAQDVAERDGATMRLALVRAAVSFASPRLAGVYGREAMAKTTLLPVDLLDGQAARELVSAAVADRKSNV